ncbi:sigma 54-interacting transcriptional regulator [Desulfovibrio inopinatus]|uniref:sigma 54-interacting transcriptional regulator n=1 Tax=Desulfovibrio inopinatus TaxID=102109 RepID=UPI00040A2130|nr:sigma 54-interacting transcriptional regulator [Desulfovibrio inopinatus]
MAYPAPPTEPLGQSDAFLKFQEELSRVSRVDRPVLIVGERGTGKELAAIKLHYLSKRWDGPMVTVNCAALTESLLESELFGHEEGAFTGARGKRLGRFESADQGTLFLDETGSISLPIQTKILRVVEYGMFERVGGSKSIKVDVRIIGATNANLRELARKGSFKRDLLDRLAFEVLHVPPLRLRYGDISLLTDHFGGRMAVELGMDTPPDFSSSARQALEKYTWPGNVRELKNVVERAVARSQGQRIESVVFDPFTCPFEMLPDEHVSGLVPVERELPCDLKAILERTEVHYLEAALAQAEHKQRQAAELLGLRYDQFRSLFRKHRSKNVPSGGD